MNPILVRFYRLKLPPEFFDPVSKAFDVAAPGQLQLLPLFVRKLARLGDRFNPQGKERFEPTASPGGVAEFLVEPLIEIFIGDHKDRLWLRQIYFRRLVVVDRQRVFLRQDNGRRGQDRHERRDKQHTPNEELNRHGAARSKISKHDP